MAVDLVFLKVPFPAAESARLESLCDDMRKGKGLHFGQTAASLLLIGLRAVSRGGDISPLVLRSVRGY